MVKAEGVYYTDHYGNKLIDASSGLFCSPAGHSRPEIREAVSKQLEQLDYVQPFQQGFGGSFDLARKVSKHTPEDLNKIFFTICGSSAVETAIKMAKKYQYNLGERGRWKVISRQNSYHGATHLCMSLGFNHVNRPNDYGPLVPGNIRISNPGLTYRTLPGDWDMQYAYDLEKAIIDEGPDSVAAFIGEPISAASGLSLIHI